MDSRIEELTSIIAERCDSATIKYGRDDRSETYKAIKEKAWDIYSLLQGYRQRHPEEYE